MKTLKTILPIIIVFLLMCGSYYYGNKSIERLHIIENHTDTILVPKVKIIHDTLFQNNEPIILRDTIIKPFDIDTNQVIEHFFSKRILLRTFEKPDVSIQLQDTIYKNNIIGSHLAYTITQRDTTTTIVNKVVFERRKARIYAGVNIAINNNHVVAVPEIFLQSKDQKSLYGFGYSPGHYQLHYLRKITVPRFGLRPKIRSPGEE